jgi:uncharacterized protein YyaL (SSP411 family)
MTALEECIAPPTTVILRGEPGALAAWSRALSREHWPSTMVLAIHSSVEGLPPVLDKPVDNLPVNAWVCQGVTCLLPISDLETLRNTCKQAVIR